MAMTSAISNGTMQAAPRPTAPPTILQDLKVQSQVKAEESSFDAMKGESMVWSLALCVICSAAVFYFYNQVRINIENERDRLGIHAV